MKIVLKGVHPAAFADVLAMLEWKIGMGATDKTFQAGNWAASPTRLGPTRSVLAGNTVAILG